MRNIFGFLFWKVEKKKEEKEEGSENYEKRLFLLTPVGFQLNKKRSKCWTSWSGIEMKTERDRVIERV